MEALYSFSLNIHQTRILYSHLNSLKLITDETLVSTWKIYEISDDNIKDFLLQLETVWKWILKLVIDKLTNDDKIKEIFESLSLLEMENLVASHKQQKYKLELKKLKFLLHLEYKWTLVESTKKFKFIHEHRAWQPEKIFQNWLENNLWIFWVEYEKLEWFRKISTSSEWDLVMKSIDWFLDLIELKRAKYDLLTYDKSHKCYHWKKNLNSVIWQSIHYIKWLQSYSKNLEDKYSVKVLRPRVKIIAWRSNNFNKEKYEALKLINSHLVDINIITYDELIKYWEKIISHYS